MKKLLLSLLFFFLFTSLSLAETYYVKNGGNDSAAGTSDGTAWAHCEGMEDWTGSVELESGDVVYFNSQDSWTETSHPEVLETVTAGVTYIGNSYGGTGRARFYASVYRSYPNYAVVHLKHSNTTFQGFDVDINDESDIGVLVGYASSDISNITVDGCLIHGYDTTDNAWGYGIQVADVAGTGATNLTCADGDAANPIVASATVSFDAGDIGERFVINTAGTGFTLGAYTITGISGNDAILDSPCGPDGALSSGGFFFGGHTISDVTISNCTVYDNDREGIALYQSWGYPTNKTDGVLVQNCTCYGNYLGVLIANDTQDAIIEGCTLYENSAEAIWVRVSDAVQDKYYPYGPEGFIIRKNFIYQNPIYGISLYSPSIYLQGNIENNIFYDNGDGGTGQRAQILLYTYSGFTFGNSLIRVMNNTFASLVNTGTGDYVGGAVIGFASGGSMSPAQIHIYNNIFYAGSGVGSAYRLLNDNEDVLSTNHGYNLFYQGTGATDPHVQIVSTTYDRNGGGSDVTTWEATAQKTDPLLSNPSGGDPANGDFNITTGSDAINNGTDLSAYFTTDYHGTSRSLPYWIGAYQSGLSLKRHRVGVYGSAN